MSGAALVVTDGSCISGRKGLRAPGGWAAVVEDGSDGWVLRGREQATSSTQMELRAAVEGLRSLPPGAEAELRFDCSAIARVHQRWLVGEFVGWIGGSRRAARPGSLAGSRDFPAWLELAREFERRGVVATLLTGHDPLHRRAHVIAQGEARAAAAGFAGELPLPTLRGRAARPYVAPVLVHRRGCVPGACVVNCPFYRRAERERRAG